MSRGRYCRIQCIEEGSDVGSRGMKQVHVHMMHDVFGRNGEPLGSVHGCR